MTKQKEQAIGSRPFDASRDEAENYEISVEGHLDARWAAWFDGLTLNREPDGTTTIRGIVADQAALHGLLRKVRDTGLPLVAIVRVTSSEKGTPE